MKTLAKIGVGILVGAGLWWLAKRAWLFREGTEAEPPARTAPRPDQPTSRPEKKFPTLDDVVDEAIDGSFPASDPPSYTGGRGDVHHSVGTT